MAKTQAIAIIPARMGATRFPGKPLASDTGLPMIVHVCQQAAKAAYVANVVVATDSIEIVRAVKAHGHDAVMTGAHHDNGTSRLAEAVRTMGLRDSQPIVNVQGDEPEIDPHIIDAALLALTTRQQPPNTNPLRLGTVASPMTDPSQHYDPNIVKVVTGLIEPDTATAQALYFSRAPIPYDRDHNAAARPLRHVGIYAYSGMALTHYAGLPPTPLEQAEKLEQLRWLEHGLPIQAAIRNTTHQGIDTPEQYQAFVQRYKDANAHR